MKIRLMAAIAAFIVSLLNYSQATAEPVPDIAFNAQQGDLSKFASLLKQHAEAGDKKAMGIYGALFAIGRGEPRDDEGAMSWWRKSGDVPLNEYYAALMLLQGVGGPPDEAHALYWFVKSAEGGYVPSEVMASTMYRNGKGTSVDMSKTYYWARKAADQGFTGMQFQVVGASIAHDSPWRDYIEGYKWLIVLSDRCAKGPMDKADGDITEHNCQSIAKLRVSSFRLLTEPQREEAQRQATAWLRAHPHPWSAQ